MTTLQQNLARLTADRAELIAALKAALTASNPAPAHYQDTREWVNIARAALAKMDAQQTLTCKVQK